MKKKIAVLGAGLVGKTIAIDLSKHFEVTSVDISESSFKELQTYGIGTRLLDVTNHQQLRSYLAPFDLVIGAVPGFLGFHTVRAVIEAGKNMVDISFFPEDPFELDALARKNKVTVVTDCGVAPGMGNIMTDLTSIGTLFAFVLVSGGVLMLPRITQSAEARRQGRFRLPYINGKFIVPALFLLYLYFVRNDLMTSLEEISSLNLQTLLFLIFLALGAVLSVLTFLHNFSLIPIMGVLFCSYLLIEIPALSWIYFVGWLAVGLAIYFAYGFWKSKLRYNTNDLNAK